MSIESRLQQLAVNKGLPVTPLILDYLVRCQNIAMVYGRYYIGRESHIKLLAYKGIVGAYGKQ